MPGAIRQIVIFAPVNQDILEIHDLLLSIGNWQPLWLPHALRILRKRMLPQTYNLRYEDSKTGTPDGDLFRWKVSSYVEYLPCDGLHA